jgi:3-oxoacyl-ACP reductase-like protein
VPVPVVQQQAPAPVSAPVVSIPVSKSAGPSVPVTAFEAIRVLLSIKLKKTLAEITTESTIKDLVGGKSAIQNEILGDLQKEFGTEPEGAGSNVLEYS